MYRSLEDWFTREPVIPTCDQCDAELPDEPVKTWQQYQAIGEYDEHLVYDFVTYRRYTCTECSEDTVLTDI